MQCPELLWCESCRLPLSYTRW
ncbi:MAG: hypothetical protein HOP30_21710 [Cyclobacteriaceae bacterium]|nr:hypothetical protein [Cyclobacteriaceae bacterium]